MSSRFTERDCERFYDEEDAHYRSFWDSEGSLHWGVFDEQTGDDFLAACANLNGIMAAKACLDSRSNAIDLGCGNGTTSIWLARATGCRLVGVDLSGVRIQNAKDALQGESSELRQQVRFERASITKLPFADGSFTHAWSQASIYHVPDKEAALREAYRVLRPDSVFVFDDLIKPKPNVSERARKFVYERLLFDTDYSFESYQVALARLGFEVEDAVDLSGHLATSYARLAQLAKTAPNDANGHYAALSQAYEEMVGCIQNRDVGWALYRCRR